MKAYLVELYNERWPGCGFLLADRSLFSSQVAANKQITKIKRRLKGTKFRVELWEIATRKLTFERLAELVVMEDIWNYLIHRKEKLLIYETKDEKE